VTIQSNITRKTYLLPTPKRQHANKNSYKHFKKDISVWQWTVTIPHRSKQK